MIKRSRGMFLLAGVAAVGLLLPGNGVVAEPLPVAAQVLAAEAEQADAVEGLLEQPLLAEWRLALDEPAPAATATGRAGGMSRGFKIGAMVTGGVVVTSAAVVALAGSGDSGDSKNGNGDPPANGDIPDDSDDNEQPLLPWYQQQAIKQPDAGLAAEIRASDDYLFINKWWRDNYGGGMPRINPYDLMGLSYAHAAGYRGEGIIIGLLDDTFQLDHPMLKDQVAGVVGNLPEVTASSDHGTHVAGLAGGHSDTMIGVAPEAQLYLASFRNSTPTGWGEKFQAAQAAGARVHSNSWGWDNKALLDTRLVRELIDDPEAALASWEDTVFEEWRQGVVKYAEDENFEVTDYANNPGLALEAYFRILYNSNSPESGWDAFAEAMHNFQTQGNGVILWALENYRVQAPDGAFIADASAAFPEIYQQLQGAWLTVANVNVGPWGDSDEDLAILFSSGCHQTASYCLSHNGSYVNSAVPFGDYEEKTGTSMATPQVAGAVAILAEAFPGHSGEQLVNRLLATASNFDDWQAVERRGNRWYGTLTLPDGNTQEVEFMVWPVEAAQASPLDPGEIGVVDFGNGITHAYSELLGHGFVNLRAALQPVGEVAVPMGQQLATVRRLELPASRVLLGPAFGDGLAAGLAGRSVAVLDGLDGAFPVPLEYFVQPAEPGSDLASLLADFGRPPAISQMQWGRNGRLEAALRPADEKRLPTPSGWADLAGQEDRHQVLAELSFRQQIGHRSALRFDYNRNPALAFGLPAGGTLQPEWMISRQAFVNPLLSMAERSESLGADLALRRWATLRLGAFQGDRQQQWQPDELSPREDYQRARLRGAAAELALGFGSAALPAAGLAMQAALLQEENTLLGSHSGGAFELADGASSYTVGLAGELALGQWPTGADWRLVASAHAAFSRPETASSSLFTGVSTIASRAFSVGLLARHLAIPADHWGLVLHQPLRVVDGQAELNLPVGHDGTALRHDTVRVDLRPTGRETRLEMFYGLPLAPGANLRGSLMLRRQPGHVREAPAEGVALLRITVSF